MKKIGSLGSKSAFHCCPNPENCFQKTIELAGLEDPESFLLPLRFSGDFQEPVHAVNSQKNRRL